MALSTKWCIPGVPNHIFSEEFQPGWLPAVWEFEERFPERRHRILPVSMETGIFSSERFRNRLCLCFYWKLRKQYSRGFAKVAPFVNNTILIFASFLNRFSPKHRNS